MKHIVRIIALALVIVLTMSIFSVALADSESDRISGTQTYTITTGKKDATLTVTQSAGKATVTKWKNMFKGTTRTTPESRRAKYYISVEKIGSQTINYPFNSKATFKLAKNSTYKVTVTYKGFADEATGSWNPKWKTYPKVKLSVNNWAKIK